MWFLTYPSRERIATFLAQQAMLPFSYSHVGASAGEAPAGYVLDHNRVQLGAGRPVFDAACNALRQWRQFPAPWTRIVPVDMPISAGNVVAIVARVYGIWWLNAARIVYVIDEHDPPRRFGFAYGTLPGHVEEGEERFTIEWHADDGVWYDLRAFSRPRHPLVKLTNPLARRQQRRFARESLATMKRLATAIPPA